MIDLKTVWGWQTNPFYDPEKCGDGGGYFQFDGGIVAVVCGDGKKKTVTVEVSDTSCGDFGYRETTEIDDGDHRWVFTRSNMDGSEDWATSDEEFDDIYRSLSGVIGERDTCLLMKIAYEAAEFLARQGVSGT